MSILLHGKQHDMGKIPEVKNGFFLVRKWISGRWLYTTFPTKDKEYYLKTGWTEISPVLAAESEKPVSPPVVTPPQNIVHSVVPTVKQKGRPKKGGLA